MPSSHLILCCPLLLLPSSLPASRSFPMSQLFAWGCQSIGVSASTSVLPMNTQDWSPLGWTDWISPQFKGLSRVFSNSTFQRENGIETCILSCKNRITSLWPMQDTACLGLVLRGWPGGMLWGGRWEGGSCLGSHVHPWWIHVNVWLNQYSIVKQNKVKIKIKKKIDWLDRKQVARWQVWT